MTANCRFLKTAFRYVYTCGAGLPFVLVWASEQTNPVSYERDVAPIMKAHCVTCHGAENPDANLNLSTLSGIRKGGIGGPTLVSGKSQGSLIIERMKGHGGKPRMPLGFAPLTESQISTVARWIDEGAKADAGSQLHWAYVAPLRPSLPKVKEVAWPRNSLDYFVLKALADHGLKHNPPAEKSTLIRRVYLDLTGLPPTPSEVDAFISDKSKFAYEKVVDRLLASPQYGERQARFWLDLARYADTDGFADLPRTAWMYRDWVIKAFNQNMPFDQFTIQQLAGDLLPGNNFDRLIATGFHRNSMFDAEMGGDPEEAHLNVIADRVSTTSTIWLGSTLQCARCHDHKYDPFTQKDFYALAAFFSKTSSTPTNPGEKKGRWVEPTLEVPTKRQVAQREKLRANANLIDREMRKWTPEKRAAMAAWKNEVLNPKWTVVEPKVESNAGGAFRPLPDRSIIALGIAPSKDLYELDVSGLTMKATGFRLELLPDESLPKKGSGRADDGSFVVTKIVATLDGKPLKLAAAAADEEDSDFPASSVLEGNEDGGWAVFENVDKPHELVISFGSPIDLKTPNRLRLKVYQYFEEPKSVIGRFRLSLTENKDPECWVASANLMELLKKPTPTKSEVETMEKAFFASAPMLKSHRQTLAQIKKDLDALSEGIATAMILQENADATPLKIPLRIRGEFINKGPDIEANTPSVLPPIERKKRVDRLALAKWLVSRKNPLTARVLANRLWEQSFGRGIVETSEDFGSRGSLPSHPELLDWMATELQKGWNVKAMQRLIVTSSTYRQSSIPSKKMLERDPKNILLARGPRVRLDAETIRDASLVFAGILNRKIGGPSVFPYQPSESTEANVDWKESHGADAYRRSLYTFMQRGYPYPLFQVFDIANRSECTARRVNTTTPLQALALLNDRGMKEAAEAFACRMLGSSKDDKSRLVFGFRVCTSRHPNTRELADLQALLLKLRTRYNLDRKSSIALAGSPERAAWTMVGNVLLNLDETINRN
ncbi:MAG TPA: PSD1 and planctomycete cytochrome C domain-containing protein [Fimbriimonadaceae bacterium]|nr:PSD1 and planctomycete cytochrome C domain-containing protein [Fimbriimonadaceae bacterium]